MRRFESGAALHAALGLIVATLGSGCGGRSEQHPLGTSSGGGGTTPDPGGIGGGASGSTTSGGRPSAPVGSQGGTTNLAELALACDGTTPSLVSGLNPSVRPDYLALYLASQFQPSDPASITLIAEDGAACAGATDVEYCEQAVADIVSSPHDADFDMSGQSIAKAFYVYTVGDEAYSIGSSAELLRFLGAIDTPNEAAVVLWANHRTTQCADITSTPGGYMAKSRYMTSQCPIAYQTVEIRVSTDGKLEEKPIGAPIEDGGCVGRRPDGLARCGTDRGQGLCSEAGCYFAEIAELELAAVVAFELLEKELAWHGAPARLLEPCRAARMDEVRHAQAMGHLARRFGGRPQPVLVEQRGPRSLLYIALENAREGSVRELYGAAVAQWQSRYAEDAEVRATFRSIAADEAQHAWLSQEIEAWLADRLSPEEAAQVENERRRAYLELAGQLESLPDARVQRIAGLPSSEQALSLLRSVAA